MRKGASQRTVPLGTVLTIPATGSEMNNGAVISRRETKEKYPFYGNYPLFSILDPEKTFTLPQRQVACGLADTFVHVMEQYMTCLLYKSRRRGRPPYVRRVPRSCGSSP